MSEEIKRAFAASYERALHYRRQPPVPKPLASLEQLRQAFDIGLPQHGRSAEVVIEALAQAAEPGLIGISSPDFYGWVMGSSHPVGIAADWLVSSWGQNAGIFETSPAAAVAEEVAGSWLLDLLQLPADSAVGFVTGATMANFVGLAAARSEVLHRAGWDLEQDGLMGAPPVNLFVGEEAHSTVLAGLRYLGFGQRQLTMIPSRRTRGFAVWAVLQALGRDGVAELVSRHCRCAGELRQRLLREPGISVLNRADLNQLAVSFGPEDADQGTRDAYTEKMIAALQRENRVFVSGARWKGRWIMRVSIISQGTGSGHVEVLADSVIRFWRALQSPSRDGSENHRDQTT